jgi:hypothetical protein
MGQVWGGVITVLMAIIGVAILAVIVSKNSNTTGVLSAGSSAFSGALGTALSPITGGSGLSSINTLGNNFVGA